MITEQAFLALQSKNQIARANLVRLELPYSTDAQPAFTYYTDFYRDIDYEGRTFKSTTFTGLGSIKHTRKLTAHKTNLKFTGLDDGQIFYALDKQASFLGKKITVKVLMMDKASEDPISLTSTGAAITLIEGLITNVSIKDAREGRGKSEITWEVANHFHNFQEVNGRLTDDHIHRGVVVDAGEFIPTGAAKRPEYIEDLGFQYANQSVDVLAQYQAKETRYKLNSSRKGGIGGALGGRNYSLEEYQVVVTKEVDLRFDLAAKYLPVVYGVQKVSGIPVFADTDRNDPSIVYVVYTMCEGEIEGFLDLHVDDVPIICYDNADDDKRVCFGRKRVVGNTISVATPNPTSSTAPSTHGQEYIYDDGAGEMHFWTYHGTPNQAASSKLVSLSNANRFYLQQTLGKGPEYWNTNHRLLDTAYVVAQFKLSDLNGGRTSIPEISAEVLGRKVRQYTSIGQVDESKTSIVPAWQTLDYLTNRRFGAKIPLSDIDIPSFIDVASKQKLLDTQYSGAWVPFWRYLGWSTPSDSNRFLIQTNTLLATEQTIFNNVDSILNQTLCSLNKIDEKYFLTVESEEVSPIAINLDEEALGDIEYKDLTGSKKYNTVQASISDPALGWKNNSIVMYNSIFKAEDKNIEKKLNLSFPYITNYYTARNLADRELKKSRYSSQVSITLPYYYIYRLVPNTNVTVTYERYGWTNELFLVDSLDILANGNISVTLEKYGKDVFINPNQADNSSNQTPEVSEAVLPPRDLVYTPATVSSDIGLNGTLSWTPSLSMGIVYYTIIWTGKQEVEVLAVSGTDTTTLSFPIYGLTQGEYSFFVKAVDYQGRYSKATKVTVQVNPAKTLPEVSNFKVINLEPGYTNRFIGSAVELVWDDLDLVEYPVQNYRVNIQIYANNTMLRDLEIKNTTQLSYTLEMNKADYLSLYTGLGMFRELTFRARYVGDYGANSVNWAEIK